MTSQLKMKYSKDDFIRAETLYKTEVVSLADYLDAKEKMELQ